MIGTPLPQTQDSTSAALPGVTADLLATIARTMIAQEPERQARIEAALSIVIMGHIVETPELGVYLVESQEKPGTYYRATSYACGCCDHQKRGVTCKHSTACTIRQVALAEAQFEVWRHEFEARKATRRAGIA